ncbi:MAG: bifunctional phosphopantothenoylcysteine decarboxylase/phosphopantothenate--cysteine ligase CoaBC [Gammaproteobacteria bacterium]
MKQLENKRILLGVTGGIAAYKSADLTRRLRDAGADVRVVMTRAATEFITPLTMQALSGNPVRLHLLDPQAEAAMGHIELARWADAILVAPASANFMAKLAHGLADDLLSTLCLACDAPLALAPAMNRLMWANPATQDNRQLLERRGVRLFGPAAGEQACGEVGEGRMVEPQHLVEMTAGLFATGRLSGLKVVVNAGPTREAIDPVRFISNRSSGKMGYAVAAAAAEAGATVTLISGPVALPAPPRVARIDVESAGQMYEAVLANMRDCDIFIGAAAVADYRPQQLAQHKIKKTQSEVSLALERTPDILASVAALPNAPFTVGFAAETEDLETHARAKLAAKGLDMVAANWVGQGMGFDSDENALTLFWPLPASGLPRHSRIPARRPSDSSNPVHQQDGSMTLPHAAKDKLARDLISVISERYHAQDKT